MNYQEMSDFEVNKAAAIALGHKCFYGNGSFTNGRMGSSVVVKGNGIVGSVDFCNSWADAGPIIQENNISLTFSRSDCAATKIFGSKNEYYIEICDKNPLRAAMIVFLMMKGGE